MVLKAPDHARARQPELGAPFKTLPGPKTGRLVLRAQSGEGCTVQGNATLTAENWRSRPWAQSGSECASRKECNLLRDVIEVVTDQPNESAPTMFIGRSQCN